MPVIVWQSDNWNYHGIMERVDPTLEYHKCELYKKHVIDEFTKFEINESVIARRGSEMSYRCNLFHPR